ncbi:MAG: hypothetical protein EOO30_20860 [Comamonadaceae bacterium]|nr:MAG: hypothetical protein EOO30_20860 [Comamonadaceae bacterium]
MFAAGAIAGGVVVLAIYLGWLKPEGVDPVRSLPHASAVDPAADSAPVQPAVAAAPLVPAGTCPSQPVARAGTPEDGQFVVDPAAAARSSTHPEAYLTVAREAMEAGRTRDAEVALIAACHTAETAYGRPSAPLADVKSQMGQHYVALAAREDLDESRSQLLQRASALFADSASAYASALGKNASKTRMAEQRLAALREPGATLPRAAPLVVAAPREAEPDTSRLGAARSSSLVDRAPLRSEDLGKVEGDLDRLYNQARSISRDPAGVARRHQQALAQRSACRGDAECLRGWAAQRKRELFSEF